MTSQATEGALAPSMTEVERRPRSKIWRAVKWLLVLGVLGSGITAALVANGVIPHQAWMPAALEPSGGQATKDGGQAKEHKNPAKKTGKEAPKANTKTAPPKSGTAALTSAKATAKPWVQTKTSATALASNKVKFVTITAATRLESSDLAKLSDTKPQTLNDLLDFVRVTKWSDTYKRVVVQWRWKRAGLDAGLEKKRVAYVLYKWVEGHKSRDFMEVKDTKLIALTLANKKQRLCFEVTATRAKGVPDFVPAIWMHYTDDPTPASPQKAELERLPEQKKRVPKKLAPKKVEPKKDAPKKLAPKKAEPKKDAPKKLAPKKVEPKRTAAPKKKADPKKKAAPKKPVLKKPAKKAKTKTVSAESLRKAWVKFYKEKYAPARKNIGVAQSKARAAQLAAKAALEKLNVVRAELNKAKGKKAQVAAKKKFDAALRDAKGKNAKMLKTSKELTIMRVGFEALYEKNQAMSKGYKAAAAEAKKKTRSKTAPKKTKKKRAPRKVQ